ncbi:MAG: class I SAM-dependent RNA methyltransferase [Myxococcota bacterium]|nr:class I SAM-dependent RNA methyltransferase [Myxococcota bacterium]
MQPTAAQAEVELVIDRLTNEGDGIARGADGRVVFVPGTAPGDRVRAAITESKKSFQRASVVALLEPGPGRTEPACSVFDECGGCTWQHLSYEAQAAAKRASLRDALVRIGKLELDSEPGFVPSPTPYGYRARARLLSDGRAVGFRKQRSNEPCATPSCPVLAPALEEERRKLAEQGARPGEWEIALGDDGQTRRHDLSIRGGPTIDLQAPGTPHVLRLSPGVFAQSHLTLRGPLGEHAIAMAGEGRRLLELYSGAGFLTLGLALRHEIVEAVESHAGAIADLRANCRAAGIRNVRSIRDRVEHWLRRSPLQRVDTLVLDPPRSGLPKGIPERVLELRAQRIVYVSCDPATLARDLRALVPGGYRLTDTTGFDLFPQTPHLEAVAVLERGAD